MLTHDILIEAGYHVVEAMNAHEALVLLDARPDVRVLFTDVKMPGSLDGYGLARIVRTKRPDVGIVVTSADHMPGEGDLPDGAHFIPKPYSPSALLEAVHAASSPLIEGPMPSLEMPAAGDSMPSANLMPAPLQKPEKK